MITRKQRNNFNLAASILCFTVMSFYANERQKAKKAKAKMQEVKASKEMLLLQKAKMAQARQRRSDRSPKGPTGAKKITTTEGDRANAKAYMCFKLRPLRTPRTELTTLMW